MSYISDFKSAPFDIYNQNNNTSQYNGTVTLPSNGYTGTGLNGTPDYSLNSLIGSTWRTLDSRVLTLVSNGATALATGVLVQTAAEVTAFQKLAVTVPTATPATAGSYSVLVTNGATVLNVNQFAGGFLEVASGAGIGQFLQIASHQAAANGATFIVTLVDPIQTTLDATSKVSLIYQFGTNVIINPTTASGAVVGVTMYPVSAATLPTYNGTSGALTAAGTPQYAFVVSKGLTSVLVDNTVTTVGYPIGRSAATPGAVGVATLTTVAQIGIAAQTLTSANNGAVVLF